MKRLIVFILLFTLAANTFAAAGVCIMEHDAVSETSERANIPLM
ncbi:hypothetical protein [Paraglaciecola algarum]|nr:hypothetical protein [Paraglaciecola sp. G1-23]